MRNMISAMITLRTLITLPPVPAARSRLDYIARRTAQEQWHKHRSLPVAARISDLGPEPGIPTRYSLFAIRNSR
jgi:hypothetical protein